MYYEPNSSRANLTVLTSAHVAKVIVKNEAGGTVTATGVDFLHGGKKYQAFAAKEVILSAGCVAKKTMTPHSAEQEIPSTQRNHQPSGVSTTKLVLYCSYSNIS